MAKKFFAPGTIVVLIAIVLMTYYFIIFRRTITQKVNQGAMVTENPVSKNNTHQ